MNTLAKLVSSLCLIGSSSVFATIAPIDTVDISFSGYFDHTDTGVANVTLGGVEFTALPTFASDPGLDLQWSACGAMVYEYGFYEANGDLVIGTGGFETFGPLDLGVFSVNDLMTDPLIIAGIQDFLDPLSVIGIDTTPLGLPVPTGSLDEYAFEFVSLDTSPAFGPLPSLGSVEGVFEGVLTLKSHAVAPVTNKIPDAASTASLGLLAFGLMAAVKRFRNKKA